MDQPRPWKSDEEVEREHGAGYGGGMRVLTRPVRPPSPSATYALLIAFVAVFLLEWIVLTTFGTATFQDIFTIHALPTPWDWIYRPWSPFTAAISHSPTDFGHIFFNGIALYFFGPQIEYIVGRAKYLIFFFGTGALSSIVQAALAPGHALGASGAIMALIGVSIVLFPKNRIFLFPLPVPIPLWIAGILFALLDLLGVFSGSSGIGNFAHLSGMAVGLGYGVFLKKDLERRGLRLVTR